MRSMAGAVVVALLCPGCLISRTRLDETRVHELTRSVESDQPEVSAQGVDTSQRIVQKVGMSGFAGGVAPTPAAAEALGAEMVPALVKRLSDPRPDVRAGAARSLRNLALHSTSERNPLYRGNVSWSVDVDAVLKAIEDPELEEAVAILRTVEPLPEHAVPGVVRVLDHGRYAGDAADVLAHGGVVSRRPLIAALTQSDTKGWQAERALANTVLTDSERAQVLASAVATPDPEVRGRAFRALHASARPGAPLMGRLVALLDDPRREVRSEAAALLPLGGDAMRAHLPRLEALLLADRSVGVAGAISGLGPTPDMARSLAAVAGDPVVEPAVRTHCLDALASLGPRARSFLPVVEERLASATDRREQDAAREARDALDPWHDRSIR